MSINSSNNTSLSAQSDLEKSSSVVDKDSEMSPPSSKLLDTQVKTPRRYKPRRSFDLAYKQKILAAYEACPDASSRGELLRREGLYHSVIRSWRSQQAAGKLKKNNRNKQLIASFRIR